MLFLIGIPISSGGTMPMAAANRLAATNRMAGANRLATACMTWTSVKRVACAGIGAANAVTGTHHIAGALAYRHTGTD